MSENRIKVSSSDMESNSSNEPLGKEEIKRPNPPYDVHIHSIRKRLGDVDGISAKAAIDGLVKARIFGDDTPEWIQKVSFSQEKGKEEKTIITINEA
jgi:Holliday junction resolvase RusA-like endonuclease